MKKTHHTIRHPGSYEPHIAVTLDKPLTVHQIMTTHVRLHLPFPPHFVRHNRDALIQRDETAAHALLKAITRPVLRDMDIRRIAPTDRARLRTAIAAEVRANH